MVKNKRIMLFALIFGILSIISFFTPSAGLTTVSLSAFSALIFFFNTKTITIGIVKLWLISVSIAIILAMSDSLNLNNTTLIVLSSIWVLINLLGAYLVKNTRNEKSKS